MKTFKQRFISIFVLFLISSSKGDSSSFSKGGKRYRTKLSLTRSEPELTHSTYLYNDSTSEQTYPTISSRQMSIFGNGESEIESGDALVNSGSGGSS
jgi:hypothetical protein